MNLFSTVSSFLLEPLKAAGDLLSIATGSGRKKVPAAVHRYVIRDFLKHNFDSRLEERISKFINEVGLDHRQIILMEENTITVASVGDYSIMRDGVAILYISSDFLNNLRARPDMTPSEKFTIAHELGHIHHDDPGKGRALLKVVSSSVRIISYIATLTISSNPLGFIGGHLLSCGISKATEAIAYYSIRRKMELLADRFAASRSKEIRDGGIEFFDAQRQENLMARRILQTEVHEKTNVIRRLYAKLKVYCVSEDGEYRLDFEHPSLTQRKQALSA